MKKKRFYNNKKRNQKWTEEVKGRKIPFADKYIDAGFGSDKFDNRRPTVKKKAFSKDNMQKMFKYVIFAVCGFAIICVGYTFMDIYIERNAMPLTDEDSQYNVSMSNLSLEFKACAVEPLSLDNGVMFGAVIEDIQNGGYTAAVFDLKRDDGTIGYRSNLAMIDTYGAVSSASSDIGACVLQFGENDILPVGRISCYKDNIVPSADLTAALYDGGNLYKDSSGNTYLNPDSESAYSYIKSIIEESKGNGISVFLLDNCSLPEEVSANYNDGFDALSKKLYNDFGDEIKLINCVSVTIDSEDIKAIEEEVKEKIQNKNNSDTVLYIKAKDKETVKQILDNDGLKSYIISE